MSHEGRRSSASTEREKDERKGPRLEWGLGMVKWARGRIDESVESAGGSCERVPCSESCSVGWKSRVRESSGDGSGLICLKGEGVGEGGSLDSWAGRFFAGVAGSAGPPSRESKSSMTSSTPPTCDKRGKAPW